MSIRFVRFALLPMAVLLAGCGTKMAQVTGTVTYDGKPLAQGTIRFETPGARPATGKVVDGKIVEVTTHKTGDGIPLGAHKVAIHSVDPGSSAVTKNPGENPAGPGYMGGASLIPTKYNDPETSGLTAEIKSGTNELKFDLKKNP